MDELPDQHEPTLGWRLVGLALCVCSALLVIWTLVQACRAAWQWWAS